MAGKYQFNRDSITVNGQTFPARYEVRELDAERGSFYTVMIWAKVDGGQEVKIEVPANDKQHSAALAAARTAAHAKRVGGSAGLESEGFARAGRACAEAQRRDCCTQVDAGSLAAMIQNGTQAAAQAAEKDTQTTPEAAQNKEEAQTMKVYNVYFTDHPTQAATFRAANKRDAEKQARKYIREWSLQAKIDRIERADDAAAAEAVTVAAAAPAGVETIQPAKEPAPVPEAPEEPAPETLEEIGGEAAPEKTDAPVAVDPKATRGAVPEKTFKNGVIAGDGWSIVFDAGCNRTRVIIADPFKKAARPIVEAAGFYYSRALDSWNKKLTFRAWRAANALAAELRAALA